MRYCHAHLPLIVTSHCSQLYAKPHVDSVYNQPLHNPDVFLDVLYFIAFGAVIVFYTSRNITFPIPISCIRSYVDTSTMPIGIPSSCKRISYSIEQQTVILFHPCPIRYIHVPVFRQKELWLLHE